MDKTPSLKEKVIKGSVLIIVLNLFGAVFAYFIRILYSRTLAIEDYGLFYAVFSLILMFTIYLDLGFGYSVVYFLPKYIKLKNYSKAWNIFIYGQAIAFLMSIVISTILILSAPFLAASYFKVPNSQNLIYVFSIYIIANSLISGMSQIFSGLQKEKYYSTMSPVRWLLTLTLSTIFILAGFPNVIFFAIAWSFAHLIVAIIYIALFYKKHTYLTENKIYLDKNTFKQMSFYAFPAFIDIMVGSVFLTAINVFLTLFKGVTEVGIYNIIAPLSAIPIILLSPLNALLLPLVSHLAEGEKNKLEYLVEKLFELAPFVGVYFSLFIVTFPSASIALVFGEKWSGTGELPLVILSLGTTFIVGNGILGVIALGLGRVRERLKIAVATSIIGIFISTLVISSYGLIGTVLTINLYSLMVNILFINLITRDLLIKIPYIFYLKLLSFSFAFFLLMKFMRIAPQNWFEFIMWGIVYTIAYVIFGYSLKIYDKKLIFMILPKQRERAEN